jgi:NADPH-dependent ferric siderophore reductase
VTQPQTPVRSGRPRPTPRRITVQSVERLSPRMRRVTFGGAELATFAWSGPAAHVKIVFPEAGTQTLPDWTPDGPRPSTMRTYTPRRFDADALQITVDFVLHGDGPGSSWAAQAAPGQDLLLSGPGRGYVVDPQAPWYAIFVDETALPATETLLEALPRSASVTVFAEVADDGERRTLPRSEADVRWLVRTASTPPGAVLEAALETFDLPAGDGRVYVGCEAHAMRRLRKHLLETRGIDAARLVTRGYWSTGEVNHPDHDYGEN